MVVSGAFSVTQAGRLPLKAGKDVRWLAERDFQNHEMDPLSFVRPPLNLTLLAGKRCIALITERGRKLQI